MTALPAAILVVLLVWLLIYAVIYFSKRFLLWRKMKREADFVRGSAPGAASGDWGP